MPTPTETTADLNRLSERIEKLTALVLYATNKIEGLEELIDAKAPQKTKPSKGLEYVTVKQLQERWGCSYTTAYTFARSKSAEAIKMNWKLLVPIKNVRRHEQKGRMRML